MENILRIPANREFSGSRLTAYELVYENIPSTLITDSMVSAAVETFKIDAIVVGADRVSRNGDTANKIGKSGKSLNFEAFMNLCFPYKRHQAAGCSCCSLWHTLLYRLTIHYY